MTNTKHLPPEVQSGALFCCWRREPDSKGGYTKIPYNPKTGSRAKSTAKASFAPLAVAEAAQAKYSGLGVGVFAGLCAIDIDHCIDEAGQLSPMALDIVHKMDAYTEYSPSGKGLRILFKAGGFKYDKGRYYIKNSKSGLEVYVAGATSRFVTVTGNPLNPDDPGEYAERGQQLRGILDKYMVRPNATTADSCGEAGTSILTDEEVIALCHRMKDGDKFGRLWNGDTSDQPTPSEADMALCNSLAFATRKDPEQMDRLFRQSGLMREKWDRATSGSTYGALTIQKAIRDTRQVYDPQAFFLRRNEELAAMAAKLAEWHPERNNRYGKNDIGNGYLFADYYKDIARYSPERKKWYVYDGRVWQPDTGNLMVMELCKRLADALFMYAVSIENDGQRKEYLEFAGKWQARPKRETVLKDAASVYPVQLTDFDQQPYLLNCQNGTLDLKSRQFREHAASDMLTQLAGVSYDPAAQCDRWSRFIAEVMQEDTEKAVFLQKSLGLALTGDTSFECFFFLYGATTRNGKGTCMETFMQLMSDYGRAAKPDTIAQKEKANGSGPSEDIARLAGARFVNISEPDKRLVLSSALVKTLTGRDTINARFLHEGSFDYRPQFKLFINTNHLPKVTDPTIFSSGRVKVIPFERHFEDAEQDHRLKDDLCRAQSLSGVLNWCLDGLDLIGLDGFDPPPSVLAATAKYREDSDKMGRFIAEELEAGRDNEVKTSDAFDRYRDWCYENGFQSGSISTFRGDIEGKVHLTRKRPVDGSGATSMITGHRLVADVAEKNIG